MKLTNLPAPDHNNLIYALQDPITLEIRYIGKSTKGIHRPKHHFYPCYYESKKMYDYPVYKWIRKLQRTCGMFPNLLFIQQFENITLSSLNDCEKYWIAYFRQLVGKKLLNTTIGGDGSVGYKWTEQQKAKLSPIQKGKKKHSEKFKKESGEWLMEAREKLGKEEFVKRVIDGTTKWWNDLDSEIQNKIISKNLTYRIPPKKYIDQYGTIYIGAKAAGKAINRSEGSIYYSVKTGKSVCGFYFKVYNDAK